MTLDPKPVLFVYYRVPCARRHAAAQAVQAMQSALSGQWPGLDAQLMRRADASAQNKAEEDTWMETYAHPEGVSAALMAAIASQATALPEGLIGVRHVETFVPLGTPPVTPTP